MSFTGAPFHHYKWSQTDDQLVVFSHPFEKYADRQIESSSPSFWGENSKKYLSCHHPDKNSLNIP